MSSVLPELQRVEGRVAQFEAQRNLETAGSPIPLAAVINDSQRRDNWSIRSIFGPSFPSSTIRETISGLEYTLGSDRFIMLPQAIGELSSSDRQELMRFLDGIDQVKLGQLDPNVNTQGSTSPVWHIIVGNREYALKIEGNISADELAGRATAFDLAGSVVDDAEVVPTYAIMDIPDLLVDQYATYPARLIVMQWIDGRTRNSMPRAATRLISTLNIRAPHEINALTYDLGNVSNIIVSSSGKPVLIDHLG